GKRITHVAENGVIIRTACDPTFRKPVEALAGLALIPPVFGFGEVGLGDLRQRPTFAHGCFRKPTDADAVRINFSVANVERAPDDVVGERGHDFESFNLMPARSGEVALQCRGSCPLRAAEGKITCDEY